MLMLEILYKSLNEYEPSFVWLLSNFVKTEISYSTDVLKCKSNFVYRSLSNAPVAVTNDALYLEIPLEILTSST